MSLEETLKRTNELLEKQNELLAEGLSSRQAILDKADALTKKSANKAKPSEEKKSSEKEEKKPKKSGGKKKPVTEESLRRAFAEFVNVDNKKEREKRKDVMVKVLTKFDVEAIPDLDEGDYDAVLELLEKEIAKYMAKNQPAESDDEDEDEDDEDQDDEDDEDEKPAKKGKSSKPAKGKKKPVEDDDEDEDDEDEDEDDEDDED